MLVPSNRWGSIYYMELEQSDINVQREDKKLIGQWRATSISGNDLIASVLYSLGPCMVQAGQFSAISMALVAMLMYPAKNIMTEVCTALPLNGGKARYQQLTFSRTVNNLIPFDA
jgi:hypothetical protein